MPPEQQARQRIDQQLMASGWIVQNYAGRNIGAGPGVAIREFPLKTGFADYLLYVGGKAIGVVEAKPAGHSLVGVVGQSAKYLAGLPADIPHYRLPLPFAYESNGEETRFTNYLEPDARARRVFAFHEPAELLRLATLDAQVRQLLRQMPPLNTEQLWRVQTESVQNLEKSLALNKPRALIQMATGSGKTFTAVNFCYRLIKFARSRRILFLVDRNNLGKQTLNEFQQFHSPHTGYQFTEEYGVQHLRGNTIDPAAKVCITTIQRLFSMLRGDAEFEEAQEEQSQFESGNEQPTAPMYVEYNPKIPIDTFDFIVIDECHRSIYNLWRDVLLYFDAFLIGLTATPSLQTIGFFDGNLVQDYSHEKAVMDGINVGYDVYRIETQITKDGATLKGRPGRYVPARDRRTGKEKKKELDQDLTYKPGQLDRDVVSKPQIRLVIQTFRDRLPEIFPGREDVPKTLVFAKTDLHADDIVRIILEEFGKGNDFCQKITSKTTGKKPDELLAEFRNSYNPRIAVTVDMIATGTDVKPLECLVFLRDVRSAAYFEQMKGRGCRVVNPDALQSVTPGAKQKTHFVIVDAVGVCESDKSTSKPLDRKPSVPVEKLLDQVANGVATVDVTSALAARLARLELVATDEQHDAVMEASGGLSLAALGSGLLASFDPDTVLAEALQTFDLPEGTEPTEQQLDKVEDKRMREALQPFQNPDLRKAILAIKVSLEQVIDEETPDKLLQAGFSAAAKEKAQSLIGSFRQFLEDHKDEIAALKILYSQPYRAGLRFGQVKELAKALQQPPHTLQPELLWKAYELVEPEQVRGHGGKQLVDVVALVRHALDPASPLAPVGVTVQERFAQWLADRAAAGVAFTPEQRKWLEAIRDHIATSLAIEREDLDEVPFNQIGGLGRAYELFGETLVALLDELNQQLAA